MNDVQYAMWRFMYYIKKDDMTYNDIDAAVARGDLIPGTMPENKPNNGVQPTAKAAAADAES